MAAAALILASLGCALPARAADTTLLKPPIPAISSAELRPGMRGHGYSVLQGTEPVKFGVTYVGTARDNRPGEDRFLVRVDLPAGSSRAPFVGGGFSGSPIYFDDRLAGAIATIEEFQTDSLVGVTPTAALLEELARARSAAGNRQRPPAEGLLEPAVKPGTMIFIPVLWGDFTLGSAGTVTFRDDTMIVAFGHENRFIGDQVELPVYLADVSAVVQKLSVSHKVAGPSREIGALVWDGKNAVVGELGRRAPSIPLEISWRQLDSGEAARFSMSIVRHGALVPDLVRAALTMIVDELSHNRWVGADYAVEYRILKEGRLEPLRVSMRYGKGALTDARNRDPVLGVVLDKPGRPCDVTRVEIDVTELLPALPAQILGAEFEQSHARPGDRVRLRVETGMRDGERASATVDIAIPAGWPKGKFTVRAVPGDTLWPDDRLPADDAGRERWLAALLRPDDLAVLYPGEEMRPAHYPSSGVDRTVLRVSHALAGAAEATITVE